MDLRLVLAVVPFVLMVAMFGVRRYRFRNIVLSTGAYGMFIALLGFATYGNNAIEPVLWIGLAFAAGAVAQRAYDDEKGRERVRAPEVGLKA